MRVNSHSTRKMEKEQISRDVSFRELEQCSYRYLQQLTKSMSLPSNVKKILLIELILAKQYSNTEELDAIVARIKDERKKRAQNRKPRKKKKRFQDLSSSSSDSPPITVTPRHISHLTIPGYRQNLMKYRRPILHPSIAKPAVESDRVLRSFNRRRNYRIVNIDKSVLETHKGQNRLEENSLYRVGRDVRRPGSLVCRSPVNVLDECIQRDLRARAKELQKRQVHNQRTKDDQRQLEPGRSVNKIQQKTPQRQLSGIYPLPPPRKYPQLTELNLRCHNGTIARFNTAPKQILPAIQRKQPPVINIPRNRFAPVLKLRRLAPNLQLVGPSKSLAPKATVQDLINYKIDQNTFTNSSTESAPGSSLGRESALTVNANKDLANTRKCMAFVAAGNNNNETTKQLIQHRNNAVYSKRHIENRDYATERPIRNIQILNQQPDHNVRCLECPNRDIQIIHQSQNHNASRLERPNRNIQILNQSPHHNPRRFEGPNTQIVKQSQDHTNLCLNRPNRNIHIIKPSQDNSSMRLERPSRDLQIINQSSDYNARRLEDPNRNIQIISQSQEQNARRLDMPNRDIQIVNDLPYHNAMRLEDPNRNIQIISQSTDYNARQLERQTYIANHVNRNTESLCPASHTMELARFPENRPYGENVHRNMPIRNYHTDNVNRYMDNRNYEPNANVNEGRSYFIEYPSESENAHSVGELEVNLERDYPNMSALTESYPANQVFEVTSTEVVNRTEYYHKKIRAEQGRTQRLHSQDSRPQGLPHITEVFGNFDAHKDVTRPFYMQVAQPETVPYRANETVLESIYNYKPNMLVYPPFNPMATTTTTFCVYSTPLYTTAAESPSAASGIHHQFAQGNPQIQYNIEPVTPPPRYVYEEQPTDVRCDEAYMRDNPQMQYNNIEPASLPPRYDYEEEQRTEVRCDEAYTSDNPQTESATPPPIYHYVDGRERTGARCDEAYERGDPQVEYSIEPATPPPRYDYEETRERTDVRCDEVLSQSSGSLDANYSQDLGTNASTASIPEMVEDALELISQDGDYMERIEMEDKMQCILCEWAGAKIILEYHIREEHESELLVSTDADWNVALTLGALVARDTWLSRPVLHDSNIYVLSAKLEGDCLIAILMVLPTASNDVYKYCSITINNKKTGNPYSWGGDIAYLPDTMPCLTDYDGLKLDIFSLDVLPDSGNLKLVNGEVVNTTDSVVVTQAELDNVEIVVNVKLIR